MDSVPTGQDIWRLLNAASQAPTAQQASMLVAEAEQSRQYLRREAARQRETDLGAELVAQRRTPVAVYSRHTAATDWLAELDTAPDVGQMQNQLAAQATLFYGRLGAEVKADTAEFGEQTRGVARKLAGMYGEHAGAAQAMFVDSCDAMRAREIHSGVVKVADTRQGTPEETFGEPRYPGVLPPEATSSQRSPVIQELETNTGLDASRDVVPVNDPGLGHADPSADEANADTGTQRDGTKMTTAHQASRHEAYSGLPQIDQTVDPSDTQAAPTPLPEEVAFPITVEWDNGQAAIMQKIDEVEQQLRERDTRRGASRQAALAAAQAAYAQVMKRAGYDASGWAGDMGAGGYTPGMQDQLGAPGHNLGQPDPVYGYGGDQGNRPEKPYGASEADDYTNDPGMDYQPGEETHYDTGGRGLSTASRHRHDPEIQRALKFIAARQRWLDGQD